MMGNGKTNISYTSNSKYFASTTPNKHLILQNILYVPSISKTLLSVSQFSGYNKVFFEFHPTHCCVKDQLEGKVHLKGTLHNGLYVFNLSLTSKSSSTCKKFSTYNIFTTSANKTFKSLSIWHQGLVYASHSIVKIVLPKYNLPFQNTSSNEFLCNACEVRIIKHLFLLELLTLQLLCT